MRGNRYIWRDRPAEDEVRALSEKANEHTTQEGSIPLPGSISDSVAHHQRVCFPSWSEKYEQLILTVPAKLARALEMQNG